MVDTYISGNGREYEMLLPLGKDASTEVQRYSRFVDILEFLIENQECFYKRDLQRINLRGLASLTEAKVAQGVVSLILDKVHMQRQILERDNDLESIA